MAITRDTTEHVARVVASAPPLTEEQLWRLRSLLSAQPEPDYAAPFDLWKEMGEWTK